MLETLFRLRENNTTVRTELVAGATTFLTMAYIALVNPQILAAAGMDKGAVFVATCLATAFATLFMALYANYPLAVAPGMGLNAYFAYSVVVALHYTWQVALGAVFFSGCLFVLLSVTPVRRWIIETFPLSQKIAISAGIGLFLAIIGLKDAGIVVADPATLVTLGDVKAPATLLAAAGFIVIVALDRLRVPGAIIIGLLGTAFLGIALHVSPFAGIASAPPSLAPTFLALDLKGALDLGIVTIVFVFLFIDLFDNTGTLVGVAYRAGFVDAKGNIPRLRHVLVVDSVATIVGSLLGTSSMTSYIESAAGVRAGGRTGLTAIVVALLFLLTLFFAPLAESVPQYATAPALLFVACLMTRGFSELDWNDVTEYAPGVVTALVMPLTFSIANGIAFGFITYTAVKLLAGRWRELSPSLLLLAAIFVIKYTLF